MFLMLILSGSLHVSAETVLQTDVTAARDGCTLLGIEGKYVTQIQEALDLINEIRYEACSEGVLNPSTGKALTLDDYVPIRWSSDLEYIARLRAAESSLTIAHMRTNGYSCFALVSPGSVCSYGEVLAWNWSETMLKGIQQWYAEKQDWVEQNTNKVTGHYTQMIDPENLYIGLATFCSETTKYYNTTAGEFSSVSGLNESKGTGTGSVIQTLEVNNSYITNVYSLSGSEDIQKNGDKAIFRLTVGTTLSSKGLLVLDSVRWQSSNPSVISVDAGGTVTARSCGTAVITATDTEGHTASAELTMSHEWNNGQVTKAATCAEEGVRTYTCEVCGETKTEAIGKLTTHTWDDGVVTKKATCVSEGVLTYTCKVCGDTKTITLVQLTTHTWNNGKVTKKATCAEEGERTYACKYCDATMTITIKKLTTHTWNKGKVVYQATCKEAGVITYTCKVCGKTNPTIVPKLTTHTWGKWNTVTAATALAAETQERWCSVCREKETRSYGEPLQARITVSSSEFKLQTGQKTTAFKISGLADGDYVKSVTSNKSQILKVTKYTKQGAVTLAAQKKTGTATLTVTLASGLEKKVTVKVVSGTVKTTKISVAKTTIKLKAGKQTTLKPVLTPLTSQQKVTYSTSDKKIAAVSAKGVVTAKKAGTAKITIRSGSKKVIVTVKVTK